MIAAILCASELILRVTGAADLPLYVSDPVVGYIPAPRQAGAVFGHDWAFNELSMGVTKPFSPSGRTDLLLIGDSIVMGGARFRQSERLGPALARRTAAAVWPISAASWSLSNELAYLGLHPDVPAGADRLIFVINSGDFVPPSFWRSELTHPRHRPPSVALFLADRAMGLELREPPGPRPTADWRKLWPPTRPTTVVLIPTRSELQAGRRPAWAGQAVAALRASNVDFIDVAADRRWIAAAYRDDMHPTAEGTKILADIIASGLRR